ncbi:hypothetical protein B5F77_01855 [Parabacteroides sp. An277]|nr:hypothetical protein B5F77_01855 [Parabacteroides sp. An277]
MKNPETYEDFSKYRRYLENLPLAPEVSMPSQEVFFPGFFLFTLTNRGRLLVYLKNFSMFFRPLFAISPFYTYLYAIKIKF